MNKLFIIFLLNIILMAQVHKNTEFEPLFDSLYSNISLKYGSNFNLYTNLKGDNIEFENYLLKKFTIADSINYLKIFFTNDFQQQNSDSIYISGYYIVNLNRKSERNNFFYSKLLSSFNSNQNATFNYLFYLIGSSLITYLFFIVRSK
ncbi:MAG TPA: hypothetical protein PK887_04995 [Ignavibacteriales bacterium]|nr:hypothetical protein [Ignavibacteriales bacterium]